MAFRDLASCVNSSINCESDTRRYGNTQALALPPPKNTNFSFLDCCARCDVTRSGMHCGRYILLAEFKGKREKVFSFFFGSDELAPDSCFSLFFPPPACHEWKKKRNIRLPLCTGAMRRDQARDSSGESVYNMPILLFFRVGSSHRLRHHPLLLLLRLSPDLFYRLSLWFLSFCLLLHVTASLSFCSLRLFILELSADRWRIFYLTSDVVSWKPNNNSLLHPRRESK